MPPCGLRPIWPVASLLARSGIAADTLPPSRLTTGQIGRNERLRIYEIDHLATSEGPEDQIRIIERSSFPRARQFPAARLPKTNSPICTRISRNVGCPTAAVMGRT